jgi:hypothetical protein
MQRLQSRALIVGWLACCLWSSSAWAAGEGSKGGDGIEVDLGPDDDDDEADEADETATDRGDGIEVDLGSDDDDEEEDDDDDEFLGVEDLQLDWGVRLQSDFRFRVNQVETGTGPWDHLSLSPGVARNQNLLNTRFDANYGMVSAKVDIDFVVTGYIEEVETLSDLSRREKLDTTRFDIHSLYLEAKDLAFDGLDLRVGQQLIMWGVGDQFNPTNNLNADDLEDPLYFGQQQGNFMVRLDYWMNDLWSHTAVLVPVFRPALLPRSGVLGAAQVQRYPFVDEDVRLRVAAEQAAARELGGLPTVVTSLKPQLPQASLENMQFSYRIAGQVADQDIALSYYRGRHDFPVPIANVTNQNNDVNPGLGINGLLETEVVLGYPQMHVYGLNMAGEVGWLEAISDVFNAVGYRIEAAFIVPERTNIRIINGAIDLGGIGTPAGEYDYDGDGVAGGKAPAVVDDTPFAKWTLGVDYTFGEHVLLIAQWVHGLVDEFGAGDWISDGEAVRVSESVVDPGTLLTDCVLQLDGSRCIREVTRPRIADYLVIGVDFSFLRKKALFRLFGILDLSGADEHVFDEARGERVTKHHSPFGEKGFGAIIYPEFDYNFGNGLELGAGALVQLGQDYGKFGDPAAGGSLVWTRAKYGF